MRSLLLALLLAASAAASAGQPAPAQEADWGMRQLMQAMAQIKSSQHKFTERRYLAMLTAPLDSSGVLSYQAPGRLEKHTLTPQDERMVLSQGILVIESRTRHLKRTMMANQYPAVGALVESIRATLAGDLDTLLHHYQARLEGDASHWRLQLIPNDPGARNLVREVRMEGRGSEIRVIEVFQANGDRSVMTVGAEISTASASK